MGFPPTSVGKESAYNAGDPGLIPESADPLEWEMATHSSILAWWAAVPGIAKVRHDLATTQLTVSASLSVGEG